MKVNKFVFCLSKAAYSVHVLKLSNVSMLFFPTGKRTSDDLLATGKRRISQGVAYTH